MNRLLKVACATISAGLTTAALTAVIAEAWWLSHPLNINREDHTQ